MNKIKQWFRTQWYHLRGLKTPEEFQAEVDAYVERQERQQKRAAYLAADIQTKRKVALDRIGARLDRRVAETNYSHDWFYQKWEAKYDALASLIEVTDEQRRSDFEMARYRASDTAKVFPLTVGMTLRQGKDVVKIVYKDGFYGYRRQGAAYPTVETKSLDELAKALFYAYPAAEPI